MDPLEAAMSVEEIQAKIEDLNKKKSAAMQMEMLDKAVECKRDIVKYEGMLAAKKAEDEAAESAAAAAAAVKSSEGMSHGIGGRSDAHKAAHDARKEFAAKVKSGEEEHDVKGIEKIIANFGDIIMYASYGVYIFWGFVCFVIGVLFMGSALESSKIGYGVFIVGLAMIGVGVCGCLATRHRWWHIMLLVEVFNVALFVGLFAFSLCATLLALDVRLPHVSHSRCHGH